MRHQVIINKNGQYALIARDGKVLGTHPSYKKAMAQEIAIELSKKRQMDKTSALKQDVSLKQHQKDAVDFVNKNNGKALFAHGTGTGKTLTAIASFENLKDKGKANRALVIVPAALQTNFADQGVKKFTNSTHGAVGSGSDYEIVSLEKFRKNPHDIINKSGADSVIIDEMHRAKSGDSKNFKSLTALKDANSVKNVIGLTGSFVSNHPREIIPLLDVVNHKHGLGSEQKFTGNYVAKERVEGGFLKDPKERLTLKNTDKLGKNLSPLIHYVGHDVLDDKDLPKMKISDIKTQMSPEQYEHYQFALSRLPKEARQRIASGLPPTQAEAKWIMPMITQARLASNSVKALNASKSLEQAAEETPKLKKIMDDVQEHIKDTPDGQAVIFTHLLNSGGRELEAGLKARGIDVGMYSGENAKERDSHVEDFRNRKKRAIILTPAGNEGISLNDATFLALADHHYNPEKNWQAIARARRFGGQSHREPDKREVDIRRYYSEPPPPSILKRLFTKKPEKGIDSWIQGIADEKDRLNNDLRDVVRKKK